MIGLLRLLAILALVGVPFAASAASPGEDRAPAVAPGAPMSAQERSGATEAFVAKWGSYVKRVYRIDPAVWARQMSSVFGKADAKNFREALTRNTFEGAMAEISGVGNRLTDKQAMELLAKARQSGGAAAPPNLLGALANDLVYTPLAPCRIIDTRLAGDGRLAANEARHYWALNLSHYTSQGGSSTDCGTVGLRPTAVAVNVTAVTPNYRGFTTVYPFGTTRPLAASVNYGPGAIVNNALIVQVPNPQDQFEFTIFTSSPADYVVDIVGYFTPPAATALECVDSQSASLSIMPGQAKAADAPACSSGYMLTATHCLSSSNQLSLVYFENLRCVARNDGAATATLTAIGRCCRVPGR